MQHNELSNATVIVRFFFGKLKLAIAPHHSLSLLYVTAFENLHLASQAQLSPGLYNWFWT